DVVGLSNTAERRLRFQHRSELAFVESTRNDPICDYHARIDRVHANFPWAKLLRKRSGDSIHRALRRIVNHCSRRSQRSGKRTDEDDASAAGIEMYEGLF